MTLPLEALRDFIGYHPMHWWGLSNAALVPQESKCSPVVRERSYYDSNAAGRREIRAAMRSAEEKLTNVLRYSPFPHQQQDSDIVIQRPNDLMGAPGWRAGWYGDSMYPYVRSGQTYVVLSEKRVIALGTETLTPLGTAAVTYQDRDGDGLLDQFTVTIATTVTDINVLRLYRVDADRLLPGPLTPDDRIDPVRIIADGTTATIIGPAWIMVKPIRYEGFQQQQVIDPADTTLYLENVQVVQWGIDATNAITTTAIDGSPCCPSATTTPPAGALLDAENGVVGLGYGCCTCSRAERITVKYVAGAPLISGQVDPFWAGILCKLSIAELARPVCSCLDGNMGMAEYIVDLAQVDGVVNKYNLDQGDLHNPFGTRRGHVEAWRAVRRLYAARGFTP